MTCAPRGAGRRQRVPRFGSDRPDPFLIIGRTGCWANINKYRCDLHGTIAREAVARPVWRDDLLSRILLIKK
jgi:hypothetical protein